MSKYNDLYNHIKSEIISGQLLFGSRLPSIRKAGELFGVSRTTVQNAYFALAADGYIISEPQSGYYVFHRSNEKENNSEKNKFKNSIKYDLKGTNADAESFDFNLWRRYIKSALRQNEKLLSYGEPQGEIQLREALSDYIRDNRNVSASPDRIVIGAGIQSLLYVLCSLIEKKESISFPDKSFVKSDFLFSDYGFDVHYRYKDARIIYVSPSHMTKKGDIMTNKRKTELIKHASETGSLIIEDDYESYYLYNTRPTP
ncbi:MAG: PLP-dependent aminotransferase family protein, partial [Clostridiales bacterium]|nr:PLP-dependent aminotransferase family protein [Clostridiales bacterium]